MSIVCMCTHSVRIEPTKFILLVGTRIITYQVTGDAGSEWWMMIFLLWQSAVC